MDDLFDSAQEALSALVRRETMPPGDLPLPDRTPQKGENDEIRIELARIPFGGEQLASSRVGMILPLGRPISPAVILYRGEEKIAEGILMVQGDKLAVKIQDVFLRKISGERR